MNIYEECFRNWYFDDDNTDNTPDKLYKNKQFDKIEEYVDENYNRLHYIMFDERLPENESLNYLRYGYTIQSFAEDLLDTKELKAIYELGKLSGILQMTTNVCLEKRSEIKKANTKNYWIEHTYLAKQKSYRCSFCGCMSDDPAEVCPNCHAKMYFTLLARNRR